tara:strand:+ start:664 stop:4047 length:3384 start_codon:yes stop_codon:yes gene_type:complete
MGSIEHIHNKLDRFIKRYYLSSLLKGALLFFAIAFVYILFWIFIEYFFWMPQFGRGFVFWLFIVFVLFLSYKLILLPLLKYFSVLKGIDYESASRIIGDAFPEIDDKLLNTIQLSNMEQTDVLLESISQRSSEFNPFSFENVINLKDNIKYIKFALAPLIVLAPFYLFGKQEGIESSFKRVIDYNTAYQEPPPFIFSLKNKSMEVIEGKPFNLEVLVSGDLIPEDAQIRYKNEQYYLSKRGKNLFSFDFPPIDSDLEFDLFSGTTYSPKYLLRLIKTPSIVSSKIKLQYPKYVKRPNQIVENFTNITVPEGTKITWDLFTKSTTAVSFFENNHEYSFLKKTDDFSYTKVVFDDIKYRISPSNEELIHFEPLEFSVDVLKDNPPSIQIESETKKETLETMYFYGQMSDDYGIRSLQMNYYPKGNKRDKKTVQISNFNKDSLTFYYSFPGDIDLVSEQPYELYFEVSDNKPLSPNITKSEAFVYLNKSANAILKDKLTNQEQAVSDFERAVSKFDKQKTDLEILQSKQRQKNKLSFNDQQSIKSLLERQEKQEDLFKRFNEQIKKSFNKTDITNDPLRREIERRLEAQEREIEKDKDLLNELKTLTEKLDNEGLLDRLEKLTKKSKSKERSLSQMLELTKRYYVRQKANQLRNELERLSKQQEQLSDNIFEQSSLKDQREISKKFENMSSELDSLSKQNASLSMPIPFSETKIEQNSIKKDQKESEQLLNENKELKTPNSKAEALSKAKKSQTKAAQKMMQIAEKLSKLSGGGGQQQLAEDATMLRQVLDNLIFFSFEQEELMLSFRGDNFQQSNFANLLVSQKNIKTHFEHIDDSLFILSLRQPKISERINSEISEVFFNIDKSLDRFTNLQINQGLAAQQYSLTASNNLANLLSDILSSMEMELSPGQGEGDMQLPDIIMSQEQLQKEAQGSKSESSEGSSSNKGQENQGSEGKQRVDESSSSGNSEKQGSNKGKSQSSDGESYFDSEESGQSIMSLYQKQQKLRNALELLLKERGFVPGANNVLEQMKKIEQSLINQGVTGENISLIKDLKYELLKLEVALNERGQDERRESKTNNELFTPTSSEVIESLRQKFNSRELLKRQTLPLQDEYLKRVLDYFKRKYDNL